LNRKIIVFVSLGLLMLFVAVPFVAAQPSVYTASGYGFDTYPSGVVHFGSATLYIFDNAGFSVSSAITLKFSNGFYSTWKLSVVPTINPNDIVFSGVPEVNLIGSIVGNNAGSITVIWNTKNSFVIAYGFEVLFIGQEIGVAD